MARTPLGRLLVGEGSIDELQLRSAIQHQARWGGRIGEALVAMGYVSEQVMLRALALQLGVAFVEIGQRRIPDAVLRLVPQRLIRAKRLLPLALLGTMRGPLVVAFADPSDLAAVDEVGFAAGMDVRSVLAGPHDLDVAIARHLDGWAPAPRRALDLPADPGPMRLVGRYWS